MAEEKNRKTKGPVSLLKTARTSLQGLTSWFTKNYQIPFWLNASIVASKWCTEIKHLVHFFFTCLETVKTKNKAALEIFFAKDSSLARIIWRIYLTTQKSLIQQTEGSGLVCCSVCVNPELVPLTVKWCKANIKMAQQWFWENSGWSHPEGRNNDGRSQQQAAEQPGRSRPDTAAAHPPAGCHLIRAALVPDSSCPCLRTLRGTQSWWLGCERWASERHKGLDGSEMHQRGSQLLVAKRKRDSWSKLGFVLLMWR